MAEPIKASIEVEIDPTPDEIGYYRVTWPGGWYMDYSAADLTRRGLPVPSPPWSVGWVDANGDPVLAELTADDVEGFCQWVDDERYVARAISSLARALRAALEREQ